MSGLDALVGRLYEHADVHETCLPHDNDQRQWTADLREAAARLGQMEVALKIVHTWASVPGALDPKHTKNICANALGLQDHFRGATKMVPPNAPAQPTAKASEASCSGSAGAQVPHDRRVGRLPPTKKGKR